MENKPRKAWVAGLLSFFTIGLGHIYAGEIKKGIIFYFCQGLILAILLPLLILKPNIYALLFALILGLVYFLYSLIDAIKTAKSYSVSYFLKRFVAIEGDNVEIKNKKLFVNGIPQNENFVIHKENNIYTASQNPRDNFGPITVPNNSLFFMGDNRDNSFDSRFWGFVDKSKIKGKAVSLYWSWDKENFRVRWDRIGKEIK